MTLHPLKQAISGYIWKHTVEKNQTNVTLPCVWGYIWKRTVKKSQTLCFLINGGFLELLLSFYGVWGHFRQKCYFHFLIHWVLLQFFWLNLEKIAKLLFIFLWSWDSFVPYFTIFDGNPRRNKSWKFLSLFPKKHSAVEKSNKCNQCDFASSHVGHLRRHLKSHSQTNVNNATKHLLWQTIWRRIWKRTVEKSQTNITN